MSSPAAMFRYAILISSVFLSGNASAIGTDTLTLGGNGGTADWSLTCPPGKRVTGIFVRYSNVIHTIKFRCTGVASNGTWAANSGMWTFQTSSDSPNPFSKQEIAGCKTDRLVAGFEVATKSIMTVSEPQLVVSSIVLACHKMNANEAFIGTSQFDSAGAAGGTWTPGYQYCPTGGVSKGAKGRRGWYLDSMALKCANPSAE